jgi:deoxyribonuclease V
VVVLRLPGLELVEEQTARAPAQFPYVPGLLSFREGPAVLAAMEKLRTWPDAVILDGQGIAHPRRLGLAAHLGLWLGIPTVGCAKSRLVGKHGEPGAEGGDWTPLMDGPDLIGSVVRTKSHVRPLYVSPGHLCDHEGARRLVLDCCTGYRVPEPTRRAHLAVARAKALGGRP